MIMMTRQKQSNSSSSISSSSSSLSSPLKNAPSAASSSFTTIRKISVNDILQYFEMKFDSFMDYPPARQCFFTFLESTQNSEISLFLEQVEFFKSIGGEHKRFRSCDIDDFSDQFLGAGGATLCESALLKACEIADTFIHDHAPNELNLKSDTKKKILDKIEKNRTYYGLESKNEYNWSVGNSGKGKHVSIVPFLDSTIFDDLESHILLSLKSNQFAPFMESEIFKEFIENQKIETLFLLATPRRAASPSSAIQASTSTTTDNIDFLFMLNNSNSNSNNNNNSRSNSSTSNDSRDGNSLAKSFVNCETLSVGEVKYLKSILLEHDSNRENMKWTLLTYSKEQEIYVMIADHSCERNFGRKDLMFYKSVTHYQYSSDKVFNALVNFEFRKNYTNEPLLEGDFVKYHPKPSNQLGILDSEMLETAIISESYEMKWPIRNREFITSCAATKSSTIENPQLETFYLFKKSSQNDVNETIRSKLKNIRGYCVSALKVEPISSTSCKATQVLLLDMKGLLTQNWAQKILTFKGGCKKKGTKTTLQSTPQQQLCQWIEKDSLISLNSPSSDAILKTLSENQNIF